MLKSARRRTIFMRMRDTTKMQLWGIRRCIVPKARQGGF